MITISSLYQILLAIIKTSSVGLLRKFFLLALFLSIIFQTGKHFWPDFAFVYGVRVDYLSPTLFLSDVVVLLLLFLELFEVVRKRRWEFFVASGVLVLALLIYLPFVSVPAAHYYGSVLFLKFVFVGYVVSRYFSEIDERVLLGTLSFSTLVVSLLGIGQFLLQSSFQGPFYFLGERAIDVYSVGAATFFAFGKEILRPYSTFPHPNVFAFYLLFACSFLLWSVREYKDEVFRFSLVLGSIALLLTFSRVVMLVYLAMLFIYFFPSRKKLTLFLTFVVVGFLVLFSRISVESLVRDISYRQELVELSFLSIFSNPIFGNGILQYFYNQFGRHSGIGPIFLQPVHNIFLLAWMQLGIIGIGGLLFVARRAAVETWSRISRKVERSFVDRAILGLLISVVVVGTFDHFLLTLQQGQLMLAIILGLALRKV